MKYIDILLQMNIESIIYYIMLYSILYHVLLKLIYM